MKQTQIITGFGGFALHVNALLFISLAKKVFKKISAFTATIWKARKKIVERPFFRSAARYYAPSFIGYGFH